MSDWRTTSRFFLLLLLSLLFGTACTSVSEQISTEPSIQSQPLVWPPAPALARVRFVRQFSSPREVGIEKGFLQQLGEFFAGTSEVHMVRPMAVVRAAGNVIYVADPGLQGVHRFDLDRSRYQLIRGEKGRPLPSPVGLAAGAGGEVYVTDSMLSAVFVIEPGTLEAVQVPLQGLLAQPTGIALDPATGRMYLADTGSHQIKIYARDGALLGSFGHRGQAAGEFNFPTMVWRQTNGNILVADSLNFRIQIFNAQGRFLRQFGKPGDGTGQHAQPKGVATDSYGHIYVVDTLFNAMQIFDTDGTYLLNVGTLGQNPGEFWLPTGIFIDDNETIYIADSYNRRVQVFNYIGGQ